MLEHNITIAWRNIRKYLSQNIISVVGLSASLICFSICMHINRFYLEQYDSVEKRDQIVDISFLRSEGGYGWIRSQDGQRLKTLQMQTLSHINLIITPGMHTYINDADGKRLPYQLHGVETDTAFAALFTPTIVAGSWEQVARNPNSLVLTATAARRIFGTEADAIGKVLNRAEHVYRNETYTVRAVMEELPKNKCAAICGEELGIDLLRVNELAGLLASDKPHHYYTYIRGLLAEGCSVEDVNRELKTVMTHFPLIQGREREENELFVAHRIGYVDEQGYTVPSLIVTGLAMLLLSVGLLNFLHFLTGTLLNRTREYSMRRLLGCRRRDLFGLLFTQMFMMLLVSGWLCSYVLRVMDVNALMPADIIMPVADRSKLLWEMGEYLGGLLLLCTLICLGLTFYIHHISIQRGIVGNTALPRHHRHLSRNFILGSQFFVCWLFVSLTMALFMQSRLTRHSVFDSLTNEEKEQILSVSLQTDLVSIPFQEKPVVCQRLAAHSGVKEMMEHNLNLLSGANVPGTVKDEEGNILLHAASDKTGTVKITPMASYETVPPKFFHFMNVELVRGTFPQKENEAVADMKFVENFGEDIIGKTFYLENHMMGYKVTGIVRHVSSRNYTYNVSPSTGYLYIVEEHQQISPQRVYLKCYPEQVEAVREHVIKELRKVFPENVEPEISTLMKDIEEAHGLEMQMQKVVLFFSVVCLIITLLGVYSAITIDTERRRREVAIRKVFGARFGNILWMFGRRYFWLLVIPAIIAFPIAYVVLYSVRTNYVTFINIGPLFWLGIFFGVALLVVLTILWRILLVARTHPADELAKS